MRRIVAIATALFAIAVLTAQAPPGPCSNFKIEPSAQIRACASLINDPFTTWQAHMMLAAAYLRTNEIENAKQHYTVALQNVTRCNFYSTATCNASICWTYALLNLELEMALAECNEGVRLRPGNGQSYNSRAFLFLKMGRFQEAVADYDRALERPLSDDIRDDRRRYALFGRGIAKLRSGDNAGGNADISEAERRYPGVTVEFALYGIRP